MPAASTPAVPSANEAALAEMHSLQEGIKAFRNEEFATAAPSFASAAAAHIDATRTAHAYAWLARTYLHLHRIPEAAEAAKKGLESDKALPNAQTAMAEVYFRQGKFAEAVDILLPLVKSQNATARTYLVLAMIHHATANYKNARSLIELAHQIDAKDPDVDELWMLSMSPSERLEEWRKRLAGGKYENEEEKTDLAGAIVVLEDQKKNQNRTCKLINKVNATETKLQRLMPGVGQLQGYKLAVKVNGLNSSLLPDTGASGILVNTRVAEKAGISKVADYQIGGVGDKGAAQGYVGFAEKVQIGELQFENCYIDVVDKKRSLDVDGLIGADVFENYLIDVDFPNERLRLSQLPPYPDQTAEQPSLQSEETGRSNLHNRWIPPEYAKFEQVYRFGHMLLLPVRLNNAPYHLFLLDTGASDNTLTPAAAREVTKIHEDSDFKVKGLSGEVKKVYTTGNIELTFGHFQQRRDDLAAFDLSSASNHVGPEISGTLGFAMLYLLEIKLDYRDNLVDFSFDPNRFH